MTVLYQILSFILAIGVLVAFHEYGHYWVAKRCGVKVLRFAIGFGRPIYLRKMADGGEFVIGSIPLGGYVRMLDEQVDDVPAHEKHLALNNKTIAQRAAVYLAGPAANLILAILFFWVMLMWGVPDYRAVVGPTTGAVAAAGLSEGDEIRAVDGRAISSWTDGLIALLPHLYARDQVELLVAPAERPENTRSVTLSLTTLSREVDDLKLFAEAGFSTYTRDPPAVLGRIEPNFPAAAAGLKPGDQVTQVGDKTVSRFSDMATALVAEAEANDGRVSLRLTRDGATRDITIRAQRNPQGRYQIGVGPQIYPILMRYGPYSAMPQALQQTWSVTSSTMQMLYRMVVGDASVKNLSGPITIATVTQQAAAQGLGDLLRILAIVSLSLCILNLLPVPMLDGGRVMYLAFEAIRGKPLSETTQVAGFYVGGSMILGLMVVALYNDFSRLIGPG